MLSTDILELTDFDPTVELAAIAPAGKRGICLLVIDAGGGTLAIRTGNGDERTLTVEKGWRYEGDITHILDTTTVAKLQVAR